MKYIDGFRSPEAAAAIRRRLLALGARLGATGRTLNIMEVCGSHTMAIARYGLRAMLPEGVELLSGPGCPVCVTVPGYIDAAIALADGGVTVATFGDMLPVPGSDACLADCRARGGDIEVCYSPLAALEVAASRPDREVVFLAIGFETTVAPVISIVEQALARGIGNVSLLTAFKCVPPALLAVLDDPEVRVDAFLCPAHVSAIIGANAYAPFAEERGKPCVIAGFEPLDILYGIQGILEQIDEGASRVENQYARVVKPEGNRKAQALMERLLEPVDAHWRGIGVIPRSGLGLRPQYERFDAAVRHGVTVGPGRLSPGCRCGDVIKGKCRPQSCSLFAVACTPEHPVGPCMVSTEGSCSATYKYARW